MPMLTHARCDGCGQEDEYGYSRPGKYPDYWIRLKMERCTYYTGSLFEHRPDKREIQRAEHVFCSDRCMVRTMLLAYRQECRAKNRHLAKTEAD